MKVDLTPAEMRFVRNFCRLDLEAIGFSTRSRTVAATLAIKLTRASAAKQPVERPPVVYRDTDAQEIGLRVLRLTPSYRHSDK